MKLTHDQQMRQALNVLKPPQDAHAQCESDIEAALDVIEWDGLDPRPNSAKIRKVVKPLLAALQRCKYAYNALFAIDEAHAHELMRDAPDLNVHIATYQEWLSERPGKPRRAAVKQRCAVKEAHALVLKYCKSKKEHSKTRDNAWHKLSAILVGDDKLDLFNHMRATKQT